MAMRYEATWESLDSHPLPEWFDDAKLGMFVDWGLYSVAGWAPRKKEGPMYPDWYLHEMYHGETKGYHEKTWGADFQRDDFIPLFTAKEYDPSALVALAQRAGMRYIVPFCKHHDGFCLWDCAYTDRNAAAMGPKRDLVRPLVDACRQAGLKFGAYFSVDEWEYPILNENGENVVRLWGHHDPKFVPYTEAEFAGKIAGKRPVRDFVAEYLLPQCLGFVAKYDPDILWLDGEWNMSPEDRKAPELLAQFYNQAEGRKEVLINDRLGTGARGKHGDVYTSEYHDGNMSLTHKWEENRSIGQSYGYNREDTDANVLSAEQLIHMFVDTVSQGGNLLLIVNLMGPGTVPDIEAQRLDALGAWLKVNGEAIYGTRQGQTTQEGNVRFTRSKDGRYAYAISLGWPGEILELQSVRAAEDSRITMLGTDEALSWRQDDQALVINIPDMAAQGAPCEHAYAFRIEIAPR